MTSACITEVFFKIPQPPNRLRERKSLSMFYTTSGNFCYEAEKFEHGQQAVNQS